MLFLKYEIIDKTNQKWYTDNLGILATNGTDADYPGTVVHEMFHALGVSSNINAIFEENENIINIPAINYTKYEQNLYDFKGHKLTECSRLGLIESPEEVDDNTFYFVKAKNATQDYEGFNGVYFRGEHVDEVLNLNGQQALIAWANDHQLAPVPGIPINGLEDRGGDSPNELELSHFELQNSLQSHQNYRNWSLPMEVELAALEDLGYTIDRRKLYGNSIYNSGTEDKPFEYINNNPFYERVNGTYIEGKPSTQNWGVGLHVYGSNVNVLQKSSLLADGDNSMGIRVDGVNNKLTIAKDSTVTANGLNGRGINFAYGKNHELNVEGMVASLGSGGKALAFDFGDNMMGNNLEYRGSFIRVKVRNDEVEDMFSDKLSALEGALVKEVNISGTVEGKDAAIYIAPNAYVETININEGAKIEGDILSEWSPVGIPGSTGILGENDISEDYIHLPEGEAGLTRLNFAGENLSYAGNIGSKLYVGVEGSELGYSSMIMNVNYGTLNYTGTANVDSVNVGEDAILQGGTFNLDTTGSNIREGLSKENSGTLTNKGMISAAMPDGEDTVLTINGNVKNDGGAFGFIASGDSVGRIEINGTLGEDSGKILAVNPNGNYLPGDTFNVSGLVKVGTEYVTFDNAIEYETSMLRANYSDNLDSISFIAENNLNSNAQKKKSKK